MIDSTLAKKIYTMSMVLKALKNYYFTKNELNSHALLRDISGIHSLVGGTVIFFIPPCLVSFHVKRGSFHFCV